MIFTLKEYLGYRIKLKRLQNKYLNCLDSYTQPLRDAKKENTIEFKKLLNERNSACYENELELNRHSSNYLLGKARKRYVPTPSIEKKQMWEEKFRDEYLILSEKGLAKVDSAILKKHKERIQVWVPVICTLTGLIGAVIGLLSLFMK